MEMKDSRKRKLLADEPSILENTATSENSRKAKVDRAAGEAGEPTSTNKDHSKPSKRQRRRAKTQSRNVQGVSETALSSQAAVTAHSSPITGTIKLESKAVLPSATTQAREAPAQTDRTASPSKKKRKKERSKQKRIAAKAAKAASSSAPTISTQRPASVTTLARPQSKEWHNVSSIPAAITDRANADRKRVATVPTIETYGQAGFEIDWEAIDREAQKRLKRSDIDWSQLSPAQLLELEEYYIGPRRIEVKENLETTRREAKVKVEPEVKAKSDQSGFHSQNTELPTPVGQTLQPPRKTPLQSSQRSSGSVTTKPFRERRLSGVPSMTNSGNLDDTTARFQRFSKMVNGSDTSASDDDESSDESQDDSEVKRERDQDGTVRGSIQESFADEMLAAEPEDNIDKSAANEAAKQYEAFMKSRMTGKAYSEETEESDASSDSSDDDEDEKGEEPGQSIKGESSSDPSANVESESALSVDTTSERGADHSDHNEDSHASHDESEGLVETHEPNESSDESDDESIHNAVPGEQKENMDEPSSPIIHDAIIGTASQGETPYNEQDAENEQARDTHEVDSNGSEDLLDGLQHDIDAMPITTNDGDSSGVADAGDQKHSIESASHDEEGVATAEDDDTAIAVQTANEQPEAAQPSQTGIETAPPTATAANVAFKKSLRSRGVGGHQSPSGHSPDLLAQAKPEAGEPTAAPVGKALANHGLRVPESLYSDVDDVAHQVFGNTRAISNVPGRKRAWSEATSTEGTGSDLPAEIQKAMAVATGSSPPASASKRKMTGMTSKHFSTPKRENPLKGQSKSTGAVIGVQSPIDHTPIKTFDKIPARIAYVDIGLRGNAAHGPRSTRLRNGDQEQWRRQGGEQTVEERKDVGNKGVITLDENDIEDMPVTRARNSVQATDLTRGQDQPADDGQAAGTLAVPVPDSSAELTSSARKKRTPSKKTGTISEHFIEDRVDLYNTTAGKRRRVAAGESANPFPPIDKPYFGIIQERTWHEPFWLIIATVFLNKTTGRQAAPTFWKIRQKWPQPRVLAKADPVELFDMIAHLGLQNQRTKRILQLAAAWAANPPVKGQRTRKLNYPEKGDGKQWKKDEVVEEDADDCAGALEIGHIPGCGAYAYDSWRIFCRDALRGVATDYKGGNAKTEDFEPEWKRVLPADKELRACLRWMWLKEGWIWNPLTGEKRRATDEEMAKAAKGEVEIEDEDERKFAAQAAGVDVMSPEKTRRGDDALEETPSKAGVDDAAMMAEEGGIDMGADWALLPSQAESNAPEVTAEPPARQTRAKKRKGNSADATESIEIDEAQPALKKAKKAKKQSAALQGQGSRREGTRHSARLVTNSGIEFNMLSEE